VADLFGEAVRQFGLPVGLLLAAVVTLARIVVVQNREGRAQLLKELEETKVERDFFRDKWLETLTSAEVGAEATKRALASGGRRRPGDR
jgi:hypothetical protein